MLLSTWIAVVGGAGQLALAAFAWSHGPRHRFPFILGFLCVCFAGWTWAAAMHQETGDAIWHVVDLSLSPYVPPLGLALVAAFTGRTRQLRPLLWVVAVPFTALSLASASAAFSTGMASWVASPGWPLTYLGLFLPTVGASIVLLVRHRRRASLREGRRATGIMGGLVLAAALALTELFADLGFESPRLGNVSSLTTALILVWLGFREGLFEAPRGTRAAAVGFAGACLLVMLQLGLASWVDQRSTLVVGAIVSGALFAGLMAVAASRARRLERERKERLLFAGRMSAQLAHDLRTPLAALRGALEVLTVAQERGEALDEDLLKLALDQEARITGALERYLRLAKLEVQPTATTLASLAERASAPLPSVALDAEPVAATLDESLLVPALQNLLRNAVEAGGTKPVELLARREGEHVVFDVIDHGAGMDPRQQALALDGFYTTKAEGTGIGLVFARRVAEAHGGVLLLESAEGRGTRVTMRLPRGE
ncbi:MAG: HAMP domain-containing histidine kinase [Deltaproteobacteria bacterium]|nr:HAMP domain-containing histidine kinase [Deltaproteobacteria bacterium]